MMKDPRLSLDEHHILPARRWQLARASKVARSEGRELLDEDVPAIPARCAPEAVLGREEADVDAHRGHDDARKGGGHGLD
jgi:hypothetical protein